MTEPATQPLLEEQPAQDAKKTPKRRTAAKPRATASKTSKTSKAAKPATTAKKKAAPRKKPAAEEGPVLALDDRNAAPAEAAVTPVAQIETPAAPAEPEPVPAGNNGPAASPQDAIEEWKPSSAKRTRNAAARASAVTDHATTPPENVVAEPPPVAQPARSEAPPPSAPGPRQYPVYVPRHVAKQLEAEGKEAPLAVSAHEAATLPHVEQPLPPRVERPERSERADRPERMDRMDHSARMEQAPREEAAVFFDEDLGEGEGIVEISGKGFGFIRDRKRSFAQHPSDIFVTPEIVRRYNLRDGQWIKGEIKRGSRGAQLSRMLEINGANPEKARLFPAFDELTVISPLERIHLETKPDRYTTRIIDLMAPIGKGQRGLIVAPPRTGKTTLLQHMADAVVKNHPELKLIILLVDERPEEVTDFKRTIPQAEIMASSNDMDVKSHTRIAQLAIERAKRLVEAGEDVFVLLDSITRVGRAFNNAATGGRTMSGGLDSRALEIPRKIFAAARNTEEAGSLTIIGTALIETNSRMDDVIFQEFKGTGNMELVLDRKISDQRIYPAADIFLSGTRREELIVPADDLHKIHVIRRGLAGYKPVEAMERLLFFAKKFPTNAQMLREIPG